MSTLPGIPADDSLSSLEGTPVNGHDGKPIGRLANVKFVDGNLVADVLLHSVSTDGASRLKEKFDELRKRTGPGPLFREQVVREPEQCWHDDELAARFGVDLCPFCKAPTVLHVGFNHRSCQCLIDWSGLCLQLDGRRTHAQRAELMRRVRQYDEALAISKEAGSGI